ncbi:two-partner secretion domain-containing protein, partial [Oleidesulfovibrio alaskensis]
MYTVFRQLLCAVLIGLMICPPAMAGGIRVDTGAPAANQATIGAAKNGIPVVNIAAPNSCGVSHNKFQDFNVSQHGVIINNSLVPGVTQLGGVLGNNPNLKGRNAAVILNEVTSSNRSVLQGYTEVFGGGHYILANPNGITIDGGGFIGTPKVTVTTGLPRVSGNDVLLDVTQGEVQIQGAGINAKNIDAFEIVSRTAQINADIHANRLDIIAGKSSYNPSTGEVAQMAPDGSARPAVVLDSTALGGMYAGRINLIGTEKGVGVNLEGIVQSTDQLHITAEGNIKIKGQAASGNTLAISSKQESVYVTGAVTAADAASVTAKETVRIAKDTAADAALLKADKIVVSGGTLQNAHLVAADSHVKVATGQVKNTGTVYSGGTAQFNIIDTLHNERGTILSKGDILMEGATTDSKMATLQNDSALIESLEGGIVIRAEGLNNVNTEFSLVQGDTVISRTDGGYWSGGEHAGRWGRYFEMEVGRPAGSGARGSSIIIPSGILSVVGLDPSRNVFSKTELQTAIAEVEFKLLEDPDYLTAGQQPLFASAKTFAENSAPYFVKSVGRTEGAFYVATKTRDTVTGQNAGSHIAAYGDVTLSGGNVLNYVSAITSAAGDISVTADTFENYGQEVYERDTIQWGRTIFHSHQSPHIVPTGRGTEVALTAFDHVYGTLDAGQTVSINVTHSSNGIVERGGILKPQDEAAQQSKVDSVTSITGSLPSNGLFETNLNPAHPYLVETNPALTDLSAFVGSEFLLNEIGEDATSLTRKRLGDAYYEHRIIREQLLSLTGRRFVSSSMTADAAQVQQLMENALAVREGLELTIGVALTEQQVAALDSDIVWMVEREVQGQKVLVPVVYLGKNSLNRIAQGDAVIAGNDVEINASGLAVNSGAIIADADLTITADNIFNSQGQIQGQNVQLAATNINNMGGSIRGGDVSLKAENDILSTSDTVTFESESSKATNLSAKGSITAQNNLTLEAGNNVALYGSEASAGGDVTISAGNVVALSTVETGTDSQTSGRGYNTRSTENFNVSSSVSSGGKISVTSGADTIIHGSTVDAKSTVDIKAGGNVAITAATDTSTMYSHNSGGGGGFSGGKKSTTIDLKQQDNVASRIRSGESITVEAGTAGSGDIALHGSNLKAAQDVTLKAAGDINVTPNQMQNYSKVEEQKSGFMGTSSMKLKEIDEHTNTRPTIDAGGKVILTAKDDVVLQSAKITSGDTTEIIAQEGQVALLVSKDSKYEREVETDMGFFSWSSSDKGTIDEEVLHTLISTGGGLTITTAEGLVVQFKESTGDVRKDALLLSQVEGLEWMGQLLEREDVDWSAVQEIHDRWSKSESGLGPGAMLIVAIVATATTAGTASGLAAMMMGLQVGANGAIITAGATSAQLAMHAALSAAFTSIGTQLITSVANATAGGDLGNNLGNIISEDGLRSLAATMVMAGTISTYASDFANMGSAGEVMAKTTVKTLTSTLIEGEALEKSFRTALGSTFASYANGEITAEELNETVSLILTGATGAAGSAITGGDPVQGAMSAIIAELAEQIKAPELTKAQKAEAKSMAALSEFVYSDEGKVPEGFEIITAQDFEAKGIIPPTMVDEDSGFHSD